MNEVSANNAAPVEPTPQQNLDAELINSPNGAGTVLRLEGNDSATFVDGDLVEVNRAR